MAVIHFRQWGYMRTGTNATRALLEANWDCKVISTTGVGKHQPFGDPKPEELHIVSIRNPWTTIKRWSERKGKTFEYGWKYDLPQYIERYHTWLNGMEKHGGYVVAQEMLALMPTVLCVDMVTMLKLPFPDYWKIPAARMGIRKDNHKSLFLDVLFEEFEPPVKCPGLGKKYTRLAERVRPYMGEIWEDYYKPKTKESGK